MLNFALKTAEGHLQHLKESASEWKLPMERRSAGESTRSRGLLAGRLAVKIEICTDSSMRGGGRV